MRLPKAPTIVLLALGAFTSAASADELDHTRQEYVALSMCARMYDLAETDSQVARTIGISTTGAKARSAVMYRVLLVLAAKLQPALGNDTMTALATKVQTATAKEVRDWWSHDPDRFKKLSGVCENGYHTYQAALKRD